MSHILNLISERERKTVTSDEWNSILLLNENPALTEEAFETPWQQAHTIAEILDEEAVAFKEQILRWVIDNQPKGNYSMYEIEERLQKYIEEV